MVQFGVAVVGAGYWGPNLIRNFIASPDWRLCAVCDTDGDRAARAAHGFAGVRATACLDDVIDDPAVDAIAIATPSGTHVDIGLRAVAARKHLLVEKPLAPSVAEARRLLDAAADAGTVVMADHTFCYTSSVQAITALVRTDAFGTMQYVDSVRVNLGLVQPDVNVFWDLAPHDLSILDHVLPDGARPVAVAAHGADPIGAGKLCHGYLTLRLEGDRLASIHVNWLSPTKIRTMIFGGSRRMVVWDDVNPVQRVSVFDRGVDLDATDVEQRRRSNISYRIGDMVAPALPEVEALSRVVAELAASIRERRPPLTDGEAGARVVQALETADRSLAAGGVMMELS